MAPREGEETNVRNVRMNTISFFVPGKPATAGSKRAFVITPKGGGRPRAIVTEDCKDSKDWRGDVKRFAVEHFTAPLEGPLEVTLRFYLPRPKGHFGSGKNASVVNPSAPQRPTGRPDALKMARLVEDALTGIAWNDDAQIVDEHLSKRYDSTGHVGVGVDITML